MDICSPDPCALRAATTLVPRLRAAAPQINNVWRGDEWVHTTPSSDCASTGFAALDHELPGHGWPRGQLVELLVDQPGIGELALLLPALAGLARTGRSCVWVLPCQQGTGGHDTGKAPAASAADDAARHALPYAPALAEAGLNLAHHIFVKPLTPRESGWALEQSLRTAHLGALVGWLPDTTGADADFRELRRLHLLAQRHNALVFVMRTVRHARSPSPAALRLRLHNDGGPLQVHILKRRGRPLMEPVVLQVHPARWNRAPAGVVGHAPGVPAMDPAANPAAASPATPAANGTRVAAANSALTTAPTPGITLQARVSAPASGKSTPPRRLSVMRTLVRAFAGQPHWTMPAALSPATPA